MTDGPDLNGIERETEEIDAIPVLADVESLPAAAQLSPVLPQPSGGRLPALVGLRSVPAIQAAAVAAGGFMAGAAVVGLARRKRSSTSPRRRLVGRSAHERAGHRRAAGEFLQIVGSRSLLVDVHLLGPVPRRH